MSYIGRQLNNLSDRVKLDSITASATATYNLLLNTVAYVPSSAESLTVSLNGVIQAPQDSYTVSGSTITFASTLSASDSIDFILAERSITLQTPSAGSVGLTQLSATGTKDATTFLRGDNTFATVSSTTINNNADNRIITGSSTANTLEGESGLTFDGTTLLYSKNDASVLKALEFKNLQASSGTACGISFDFELDNTNSNNPKAQIAVKENANDGYAAITFSTSPQSNSSTLSEHMRINADGRVAIGVTGTGAGGLSLRKDLTGANIAYFDNTSSSNAYGPHFDFANVTHDNNSNYFLTCEDSSAVRLRIYSDGDIVNHDNSYGAISDVKLKEQIVDSPSQWNDIKSLRVRKFKLKEDVENKGDSDSLWRIGLVAQEAETVSPNLVSTDPDKTRNSETGEIENLDTETKRIKYSVLYMKAVKALQEAMTKIETLEAENTDIKARLTALENA